MLFAQANSAGYRAREATDIFTSEYASSPREVLVLANRDRANHDHDMISTRNTMWQSDLCSTA